ncbi:MAG: aldose epimerase family protein [Gammaproteobacteria bacterium]
MNAGPDHQSLETATLESPAGLRVEVLNLGASLVALEIPAASGRVNTVLRYPDLEDYRTDNVFMGVTVGPFANRIRGARFALDDISHELEANEATSGHCLHGGTSGLHRQYFDLHTYPENSVVACRTVLPDGLGGFPGRREVTVTYTLLGDLALAIDFDVVTDRDTVISLANHAYFNLGGALDDHELEICADAYTPVDSSNAPTGETRSVEGSEFDLRALQALGDTRFDHNFIVRGDGPEPRIAAILRSLESGIQLTVLTTQPGLQLFTGDSLDAPFGNRAGLCLEAQGFPDAPNQPSFPSARLNAGSAYRQRTIYVFAVRSS